MGNVIYSEIAVFAYSCILGAGLGLLYDFFRILRMIINPKSIATFFQDVIYFILSGIITFVFVLGFNSGESRFYILAGEGIGWIIYHLTIGEVISKSSRKTVRILHARFKVFWRKMRVIFNNKLKSK